MKRDLRLFYLFRLLATSYLWVPIFYAFMRERGLDFSEIMALSAVYSVVVILVEIPTGAFGDRIGRRHSMMVGALSMVVACLIAYRADDFVGFAIAEVFAAMSMSLCSGADSAYLFDLLLAHGQKEQYSRLEGTASAWHLFGQAAAFVAGGELAHRYELELPYLVTSAVSGLAFVTAFLMRDEPNRSRARNSGSARGELGEYVAHMRSAVTRVVCSPTLLWAMAYSAVVFVLLRATIYLYQPLLQSRDFDLAETGRIFAGVYLVSALVAHHSDFLRRMWGERNLVWGLLAILGVGYLATNLIPFEWRWGLLALLGIKAVANGLYSPIVKSFINREIATSDHRATMLSVESIVRRAAMGVLSPILGYWGEINGIYWCGAIGLVGLVGLYAMSQHAPMPVAAPHLVAPDVSSSTVVAAPMSD